MKKAYWIGAVWGISLLGIPPIWAEPQPSLAEQLNAQAANKVLRGDLRGSLPDFEQAIQADPDYAEAYVNRSYVHNQMLNFELAIRDASQAIRLDPYIPEAYFSRGIARLQQQGMDAALPDFQKALDLFRQSNRTADLQIVEDLLQRMSP